MKPLFDENEKYTMEALNISEEVTDFAVKIFHRYSDVHSKRELAHIMHLAIVDAELEVVL